LYASRVKTEREPIHPRRKSQKRRRRVEGVMEGLSDWEERESRSEIY
jgi:hypothetical protein